MRTLYHVTAWDRLPSIIEEGIRHQKETAHPGALGQDVRTVKNAVFAFDNAEDAIGWALRWSWDGAQECAVIRFTSQKRWVKDKHLEAQFAKGKWLACRNPVPPEQIDTIIRFNPNSVKCANRSINYLDGPLKEWVEEGRKT